MSERLRLARLGTAQSSALSCESANRSDDGKTTQSVSSRAPMTRPSGACCSASAKDLRASQPLRRSAPTRPAPTSERWLLLPRLMRVSAMLSASDQKPPVVL